MDAWTPVDRWHECAAMERPGTAVEVRNANGQSLFTACSPGVPGAPFDWKSGPVEFRIVAMPPPRRSEPIPFPAPR